MNVIGRYVVTALFTVILVLLVMEFVGQNLVLFWLIVAPAVVLNYIFFGWVFSPLKKK